LASPHITPSFKRIGLIVKHHHPEAEALASSLVKYSVSLGCQVLFADESEALARQVILAHTPTSSTTPQIQIIDKKSIPGLSDLIIVLGGDGTFLSIARLMQHHCVPVLGVNMGQLGFLTETMRNEALATVKDILEGKIVPTISERTLLEVTLKRKDEIIFQGPVVNDAVISKGAIARIIGMHIWVGGRWVHHVRADGIIVSTPTGSTAYSLAAGGPIVEPTVPALILTPICPHSLTHRPIVIPDHLEVKVCLNDRPGHVLLTLDGQDAVDLVQGDCVHIKKFEAFKLQVIANPNRDYYALLREKLKLGARQL
jgi:NAD+ kinase